MCQYIIFIYLLLYILHSVFQNTKYIIIDDNFNTFFGEQQIYRKYQQWYLRLSLLMQFDNRKNVLWNDTKRLFLIIN